MIARPTPGLPTLADRRAGLLLHPTSLPGRHGSGDLGPESFAFVDALARAGQSWWQMLPVVVPGEGNAPYSAPSAFAGNPWLINLEALAEEGWLTPTDVEVPSDAFPNDRVDVPRVTAHRTRLLRKAHQRFVETRSPNDLLDRFTEENLSWLHDYALYTSLKRKLGKAWTEWPAPLRDREAPALAAAQAELVDEMAFEIWCQAVFERQWSALAAHAHERGVALLGDVPIFVDADSVDVWVHRKLFDLRADGTPRVVAGVPPDAFSDTGQRWGNALYVWDAAAKDSYAWWLDRLRLTLARFDAVRIDHFIGFYRYWEIPAEEPTAVRGEFRPGPRGEFFSTVSEAVGLERLMAEDLGVLIPEISAFRERLGIPGMRVMQFSLHPNSAESERPHAYPEASVAYTGTHDNDTSTGWLRSLEASDAGRVERQLALDYVRSDGGDDFHWAFIRAAMETASRVVIVPVQDVLGLGSEARMNRPGSVEGNWTWRLQPGALNADVVRELAALTQACRRHGHAT